MKTTLFTRRLSDVGFIIFTDADFVIILYMKIFKIMRLITDALRGYRAFDLHI